MRIAVDFDGTCVAGGYPDGFKNIGAEVVLKEIAEAGHDIILYTRRSHKIVVDSWNPDGKDPLQIAIDWFKSNDIPLYAINEVSTDRNWSDSPKLMYDYLIDDRSVGIPLTKKHGEVCVDWGKVERLLVVMGII